MIRKTLSTFALLLFTSALALSQTVTTVVASNDSNTLLKDQNGTPLTQGVGNVNGDGALIQLGYYSSGTTTNNFGTGMDWVALTGAMPLLPNTKATTVGDTFNLASTGAGAGVISFTQILFITDLPNDFPANQPQVYDPNQPGTYPTTSQIPVTTASPPASQVLSIRFFDNNAGNHLFNAVSSDGWLWKTPDSTGTVTVFVNLATSTLEWQDAPNPFKTTLQSPMAIPEPSTYALIGLGAVGMLALRRRVKN